MAQLGIWNSKGGVVLNKYLVARVFAFDDHASEARAACVAKGWEDVRRGPPWLVPTISGARRRGVRRQRVQAVLKEERLESK